MTLAIWKLKRAAVTFTVAVLASTAGAMTGTPTARAADPPSNDVFPGTTVTGASGQDASTLVGATTDIGEEARVADYLHGMDIWWTWQATANGTVSFDTRLGDMAHPSRIYVTTGDTVGDLTTIVGAAGDNMAGANAVLPVTAGTVFHVGVGPDFSDGDMAGAVTLRWNFTTAPPANDAFPGTTITGSSGTATAQSALATPEPGEPITAWGRAPSHSVWWSWTPESSGHFLLDVSYASAAYQSLGVYTDADPAAPTVAGLSLVTERDGQVLLDASAGTTYRIRSSGDTGGTGGVVALTWAPVGSAPTNDDYAAATTLTGTSGTQTESNVGATEQPGEYSNLGLLGSTSVWWKWQAPATGLLDVNMFGSNFPSELVLLTGTDPASPDWANVEWVASDTGWRGGSDIPAMRAPVIAGTVYYIGAGGSVWSDTPPGYVGDIVLNWQFQEDTAAPDTTMTSAAPRKWTDGTTFGYAIDVTFTGTDDLAVKSYQCQLDTGAWTYCYSSTINPWPFENVTPGVHQVSVRAVDYLNKVDPTPASTSVTVTADTTKPTVTGLTATLPKGKANANTVVVTFSVADTDDAASTLVTECRLDSGAWVVCASGDALGAIPGGLHTVTVRSTDPYNNSGTASVQIRMKGPRTIK